MKVLLIGGNGQLGTTLSRTAPGTVVLCSVDLPAFDISRQADIDERVRQEQPDLIVNASAYTAVDRAEEARDVAFSANATGPRNLARTAKTNGIRLIHVSTDYVFDGSAGSPYAPQAACRPLGVYGQSKREGEVNIASEMDDWVIIRTSWLYSRYGGNFVLTMLRLMREKESLSVVADQIGSPTWATTLANAIWGVAGNPDLKGFYHWADAGVASWYDFAVAIQEEALAAGLLTREIPIQPIPTAAYPTAAKRPAYSVLDCTRSWQDFRLAPIHWRRALRQMIAEIAIKTERF